MESPFFWIAEHEVSLAWSEEKRLSAAPGSGARLERFASAKRLLHMAKAQLLEEIKSDPPRYYHAPSDVMRDRRFSDTERLQILAAWEGAARADAGEHDEEPAATQLRKILQIRAELEARLTGLRADP
jgi:hypothetical protein